MKILFPLRSFRHPQYRTRLASEAQVARGRAFTMPRAVMTAMSSCLITIFTFERVLDAMLNFKQFKTNKIRSNPILRFLAFGVVNHRLINLIFANVEKIKPEKI